MVKIANLSNPESPNPEQIRERKILKEYGKAHGKQNQQEMFVFLLSLFFFLMFF